MQGLASEHLACPWGAGCSDRPLGTHCGLSIPSTRLGPSQHVLLRLCEHFERGRRDRLNLGILQLSVTTLARSVFWNREHPQPPSTRRHGDCPPVKKSIQASDFPVLRRRSCPPGSDQPSLNVSSDGFIQPYYLYTQRWMNRENSAPRGGQ